MRVKVINEALNAIKVANQVLLLKPNIMLETNSENVCCFEENFFCKIPFNLKYHEELSYGIRVTFWLCYFFDCVKWHLYFSVFRHLSEFPILLYSLYSR